MRLLKTIERLTPEEAGELIDALLERFPTARMHAKQLADEGLKAYAVSSSLRSRVLEAVHAGCSDATAVGRQLGLPKGTVSRALDSLIRDGQLRRSRDGRAKRLVHTPTGGGRLSYGKY